jgi:hypothetical protein
MANLKGGNVAVRFLLAHGEKLGMTVVVACVGLLFWSAIKHDHLKPEQQSDKLVQLANQASQHVEEFTWDSLDPNSKLQAEPFQGDAMAEIVAEHFPPIKDPWDRPVLDPVSQRTDPELLVVEDLEVHGDSGLWALADPATIERMKLEAIKRQAQLRREEEATRKSEEEEGGRGGRGGGLFDRGRGDSGRRGQDDQPTRNDGPVVITASSRATLEGFEEILAKSWVTVVAKVPIKKQTELYDEALMESSGYSALEDVPIYRGYIVERAEVTDEGQGEWARVASIDERKLESEISNYPFDPEELISGRCLHPLLTHPLPPLILRDWDRRVTHTEVPLAIDDEMEEAVESEGEIEEDQPAGEDSLFAAGPIDREAVGGGEEREGRRGPGSRSGASRRYSGSMENEGGRGVGRGSSTGVYSWNGFTPYVLFRYFDDTVEPGHRYRYRVRLALADVNHEVPEQFLDKTVIERREAIKSASQKAFRLTDWSQPSPVASVPLPARVYLASAKIASPTNLNAEPEAKFLVQAFNSQLPAEIAMEESFLRGNVLNVHNKASVMWVNRSDLMPEQESQDFDFLTGITVVDFRGGEPLNQRNRDLTAPAQAVLMDAAGRLFLQTELGDSEPLQTYQQALEGEGGAGGRERRERAFEGREGG